MGYRNRATVRKVRAVLEEKGVEPRLVELDRTARSAKEAAEALGVRVEQILNTPTRLKAVGFPVPRSLPLYEPRSYVLSEGFGFGPSRP